jgi:hypothetical protein
MDKKPLILNGELLWSACAVEVQSAAAIRVKASEEIRFDIVATLFKSRMVLRRTALAAVHSMLAWRRPIAVIEPERFDVSRCVSWIGLWEGDPRY